MNGLSDDIRTPTRREAEDALALLTRWARGRGALEVGTLNPALSALGGGVAEGYPALSRLYPEGFVADPAYRATLPDLQNGPATLIRGAPRRIQHVGVAGFRLPLRWAVADGEHVLETAVTGTVSLEADRKGINMSRIMRGFYDRAGTAFDWAVMEDVLDAYLDGIGTADARLHCAIRLPLEQEALRSGLVGWQHYDVGFEVVREGAARTRILHVDYLYSSTCPCSLELSEHARRARGQLATPHSQRSVARLSVVVEGGLDPAEVIAMCRAKVPTEVQVMVKREDEQAFAELNAANPIFVEDAARLFAEGLNGLSEAGDFCVACSHQESLHAHDAVSVLTEGETFAGPLPPDLFAGLRRPL
ncbi:GTP cyclohydrolase I [Hasllibacter halocynthiae]|uniref:GTP cyclohydrolase I n=1 Tax=Hasllibacter halocynthiae TaxID=595589 RepID=A0A2T0X6I6_9RHOB|nr:GTP cyclohydrolase FolE2 [Hasllibacter halocynthiae]PRY94484.1 GTP cyclohydrolase I [Hasllibacter halocynthiae]